jgi:S1-C subfamily serine protease
MLENVALRERSKSRKHIVMAGVGVVVVAMSVTLVLWWNQVSSTRQLDELKEKVQGTEAAVETIRSQTEDRIQSELARFDQELHKLEGVVSQSASEFGRVMVKIQERERLLRDIKDRQDLSNPQREQLLEETHSRLEALGRELEKAEEALRAGSSGNWQQIVEDVADSVFLCVSIDSDHTPHLGTGFVLASDGVLVTSARVARGFDRHPKRMAVQNRTGKVFEVAEWKIHPDYDGTKQSPAVALIRLKVADGLTPIPVAPKDQLEKLRIGTHLGTLGYPAELASVYLSGITANAKEVKAAAATFKDGWIGRITNFQLEPTDFDHSQLIQHSASLTEGADGSPLINSDGKVVGVHLNVETVSYVTKLENGKPVISRSSNPAEIGYAVRIDVAEQFRQSLGW